MLSDLPQNAPFTKANWLTVLEMAKQDVVRQVWYNDEVQRFKYAYISCFPSKEDGTSDWMYHVAAFMGEVGDLWDYSYYTGVTGWINTDQRARGNIYEFPTTLDELTQLPPYAKLPAFCINHAIIYTDHTYDELQVKERLVNGDLEYTPSLCKVLISPKFTADA